MFDHKILFSFSAGNSLCDTTASKDSIFDRRSLVEGGCLFSGFFDDS